ncbi:MAG: hypothetical protein EAX95_06415 [Candidatus Thorarchaeota archaeon]|nr:hypothetical protein [Candidatus Thorarchaeota archaeon]
MNTERTRLLLVAIATVPILVGSAITYVILDSPLYANVVSSTPQDYSFVELAIQAIVSIGLGATAVFLLSYAMERRGPGARKLMVAMVVSPILTLVFFVLGQSLLLILFKGATNTIFPSILSIGSLAIFMLSIVFIVMDAIPPMLKNLYVGFYGSVFGTFLGITFFTSSMVILVGSLVIEDLFLTRFSPAAKAVEMIGEPGSDPFDYTRIQGKGVAVGAGDFVAFSLISAHTLLYFPIHVFVMTVALIIIGLLLNATIFVEDDKPYPGIPLPAIMAIFPWLIHIGAMAFILG